MRHSTWAARTGVLLLASVGLAVAIFGVWQLKRAGHLRPMQLLAEWKLPAGASELVVICPNPLPVWDVHPMVVMRWDRADLPIFSLELPDLSHRYAPNRATGNRVP